MSTTTDEHHSNVACRPRTAAYFRVYLMAQELLPRFGDAPAAPMSAAMLSSALQVSKSTVERAMAQLIDDHELIPTGATKGTRYYRPRIEEDGGRDGRMFPAEPGQAAPAVGVVVADPARAQKAPTGWAENTQPAPAPAPMGQTGPQVTATIMGPLESMAISLEDMAAGLSKLGYTDKAGAFLSLALRFRHIRPEIFDIAEMRENLAEAQELVTETNDIEDARLGQLASAKAEVMRRLANQAAELEKDAGIEVAATPDRLHLVDETWGGTGGA